MAKVSKNDIVNMSQDWGYDSSTGLPFSGRAVQKFIKEQLNSKGGYFYKDVENNKYLVFADEDSKDEYLSDPTKTELILGMLDASSDEGEKYTATVNLSSPMYNTIQLGAKGNYINFTFDVLNASGLPTGEPVTVTFKISRGSSRTEVKEIHRYGSSVSFNLDNYLGEGTNIVSITVTGQTSLASTSFAVTYDVINLSLNDYLDISKVYDLSNNNVDYMEIAYDVTGTYTKIMEWYIDGVQLELNRTEDEILETVPTSRVKTIELSNLQQGRHNLQFRVGSKINGEMFYSDVLYRDFFVYTGANDNFMMGVATAIPTSYGILTDGLVIHDMVQYVGYKLKVASYSPINTAKTDIAISLDNELVGNVTSRNGLVTDVIIVANTDGSKTLKLSTEETEYLIPTEVSVTDMALSEITSGLKLNFTARGRNNNSSDKETWTDGTTTATLTGFQWNNQSGWVNDRLEISEDAELHIEYAPLSSHDNGKTIEVEWSSKNVSDENAVLCDLRNDNGTGILITATSVVVTSANNVSIERRYKSDENVRMSIVVNPNRGTNQGLTFIYINGVISGAINVVEGDNYISDKDIIFKGSTGAIVSLKSIRVYDVALSTEQILNNFNLYRDTLSEMLDVYNRNSIYDGNLYDTSKMASRLPVMIVTGEIPTLENTNDKDTQIIVDIEYINMQDTTRSFTMKNAAMRPQGTSSMGYPKKNFRIYTKKVDNTILTVNGTEVEDKLYSFKENAIPVDCWCLKADYAESSGTHNVGIARMWGDAFKNAQVTVDLGVDNPHNLNNAYALRTTAQQKAIDNNYKYDVRTTIDGFPILLFYRRTPESDIIFLGKYNFNNDKSTEKVFGFTDIPGFDNTRMQCWELLNNGNPIGLFTDISDFYNDVTVDGKVMKGWQAAFESRYPDTKTPNTNDLYDFVTWVNECKLNMTKFSEEKWEHLDVYKVAGYYCYLMRHGAADQFVKNAMLTSEDGEHFYFILYDNDTINGLNNSGDIAILPTDNRESVYANGSHKFAGYDSVLWNLLERDEEFTQIVQAVDNALYSAGISYKNAISMFDGQQADKWVERVYNLDAEYKYISPYTNNGTNNLFMLQGDREIHRKWWLSNRYSLYDSLFVSGAYKSGYVEIKCVDETMPTQSFSITSGYPLYYGYGINGKLRQRTDELLAPNSSYTFAINEKVNLGDPIAIYGAPHIKELNLSTMSDRISVLQLAGVYDEALGTKLEVLKVGSSLTENVTLKEISGIKSATALTHLDVTNMKGLTAIDLSNNAYLKELKAEGTNIASATFAVGAPIEHLVLPETFRTVKLSSLPALSYEGLELANINNVESFDISECPNLSNDFSWVYAWYQNKNVSNENAVLHMDNVDWTDINPDELVEIVNIGNLKLKGRVRINRVSQEIVDQLKEVFGETVFNKTSEFYITAPDGVYLSGTSKLLEGESARYVVAAFSEENGRIQFSLPTTRQGCSIDATSGRLTTTENGLATSDIVVRSVFITDSGKVVDTTMNVTIEKRSYPTAINIEGNTLVSEERSTFTLSTTPAEITGLYRVDWTLGDASAEYLTIEESNNTTCVIKRIKEGVVETTLTATMVKLVNGTTTNTVTKNISLVLPGVVITKSSNAPLQECLYNNGLVAHEDYSEAWELALITADQLQTGTTASTSIFYSYKDTLTSLDELKYFSGLTVINPYTFYGVAARIITLPETVTTIGDYAFSSISAQTLCLPDSVTTIGEGAFKSSKLTSLVIPKKVTSIPPRIVESAKNLEELIILAEVTSILDFRLSTTKLNKLVLPETLTSLSFYNSIQNTNLPASDDGIIYSTDGRWALSGVAQDINIVFSDTVKGIAKECFRGTNLNLDCNNVKYFGGECFYQTTGKLIVRNNITEYALKRAKFTELVFEKGVTEIPERVIGDYSDNTRYYLEKLTIANTVKSIGMYAFQTCTKLKEINIYLCPEFEYPNSKSITPFSGSSGRVNIFEATEIGDYLFIDSVINEVYFNEGVTKIGYLFGRSSIYATDPTNCKAYLPSTLTEMHGYSIPRGSYEELTIPSGVTLTSILSLVVGTLYIGDISYSQTQSGSYQCSQVDNLFIAENAKIDFNKRTSSSDPIGYYSPGIFISPNSSTVCNVHFANMDDYFRTDKRIFSSYKAYVNGEDVSQLEISEFPSDIQTSVDMLVAFANCEAKLKNLIIPNSISEILPYTFRNCSIERLCLSNTIVYGDAFHNATIDNLICGNGVSSSTYNYTWGFSQSQIGNIEFDNVSSIGTYTFRGATILSPLDITPSEGSLRIDNYAFYDSVISSITIHGSVSLGANVFYNSGITNFTASDITATSSAFNNATQLETINATISQIPDTMFKNCGLLKGILLNDTLKTIGKDAFYACSSLEEITIPATVKKIDQTSFLGCVKLKTIKMFKPSALTININVWGISEENYTGRNTYNTGENILYVPQGATGYDTGAWLDPLQNAEKCGFTISYTL